MMQVERDRLVALRKAEAAEELGLSTRQVKRLVRALKKRGDEAVVHRLRGDGTMAVRHEGRYLPFELCEPGWEDEPVKSQPKQRKSNRQAGKPGSNWNQNFDLKNSPPMWKAAPSSGRRKEETD